MCLIVNQDVHDILHSKRKPFIAPHDILVFKQLSCEGFFHKKYSTPFIDYPVKFIHGIAELGIPYPVRIDSIEGFEYCVNVGIHSIRDINIQNIDNRRDKFYLAIIPEGTTFFVGKFNDMVSDHLIIFKNHKACSKFLEKGNNIITAQEMYG